MCGEEDDKIGEINGAGKRREERAKGGKVHDGGEGERVGPAGNRVLSPCVVPVACADGSTRPIMANQPPSEPILSRADHLEQ